MVRSENIERRTSNAEHRIRVSGRDRLEIIWIEQAPLRASVAGECTEMMARLERARLGWHQFERQDKPAFVRWRAREFGALLSTARDVEDQIRDAQNLIHEVEMEMRRKIQDPQSAYRRVMFRRENPGVAVEEQGTFSNRSSSTAGRMSEFEQETLFQEWVKKFLGTNPDKMDDDAYSTSFEVFKSHMFVRPESRPSRSGRLPAEDGGRSAVDHEEPASTTEPPTIDPRVKEIYRRLVRRLHPDLRADGDATVSSLWHEVQEAYAAGDVARLELLLGLSDLSDTPGAGTTISQMRMVLSELTRSVRALELSLVEAGREDSWNFSRTGPSEDLRLRVERQLKHDLALRQQRLDLLTGTIARWAGREVERLRG